MFRFALRRLTWMLLTLWVVFTVSFFLMRSVPGGPFQSDRNPPPAIKRNIEERYRLNDPLLKQYWDHLSAAMRLDFGASFKKQDYTVAEVLAEGFPVSATLGLLALVLALAIGTTAGVVSAARRHSLADHGLMALATLGIAVPNFVLASLAILQFAFLTPLFPPAGWGTLAHTILPACCLAAAYAAYIARLTRTGMLETLGRDYIRTAHAKGLPERRVLVRHALRGALAPVVSFLGPATAGILTGSVVLERIFNIPGMGTHFVEAALQRDFTLAMGALLAYTFLLFVMNALVDVAYSVLDPRVKLE